MRIFNKPLSAYFRLAQPFVLFVLVLGVTRLVLSLAGVPDSTTRWLSMSVAVWIGVFYFAYRIQADRFGTYRHLLPVVAILNVTAQLVAIVGIAIAIFTGVDNVFTAPEYGFGGDAKTWIHLLSHIFVGCTVGTLVLWTIGSLVMRLSRSRFQNRSASSTA